MFNKEKLKAYMEEREITYRDMGELLGVTGTLVSYIIRGLKQPSLELFSRICKETGMTADELIVK